MSRPAADIEWASGADATINEPATTEKSIGFVAGDKPPAGYLNWFWNLIALWVMYLRDTFDMQHNTDGTHEDVTASSVDAGSLSSDTSVQTGPDGFTYSSAPTMKVQIGPEYGGWTDAGGPPPTFQCAVPFGVRSITTAGADLFLGVNRLLPERDAGTTYTLTRVVFTYVISAGSMSFSVIRRDTHGETIPTSSTIVSGSYTPGSSGGTRQTAELTINTSTSDSEAIELWVQLAPSGAATDVILLDVTLEYTKSRVE